MKVDTSLTLMEYLAMVELISSNYFSSEGDYQPHIGFIGSAMIFWNYCVKESDLDSKYGHNLENIKEMEEIIADKEFITEYAKAIDVDKFIDLNTDTENSKYYVEVPSLDFCQAYTDAWDIVKNKLSSGRVLVDLVKNALSDLSDAFAPLITSENMEKIKKISNDISNGTISTQSLINEYKNQAFTRGSLLEK